MKTQAAVLLEVGAQWSIEEVDLDPPRANEVLIRWEASGMCHSDEHVVTSDRPIPLPAIGGHEGTGVIEEVGPGVTECGVSRPYARRRPRGRGRGRGRRRRRGFSGGTGRPRGRRGASHRGRPVPFELDQTKTSGATHVASSIDEAFGLVQEVSWGEMADVVICTMGVGHGELMSSIVRLGGKRSRIVATNIHPAGETTINLSMGDVLLYDKAIPLNDIRGLLRLYRDGQLDLDGMVTQSYSLGEINDGYQDMRDGKNIRGVILHAD